MSDNFCQAKCSLADWAHACLIAGRPCFAFEDAAEASGLTRKSVALALHRIKNRGQIVSPMKGFYVCVPDRYELRGEVPPSFYLDDLMRHLGRDYYLGLTSAAAFWGAGHQRVQKDFAVVATPRLRNGSLAKGMLELLYRSKMPQAHVVTRNTDGGIIRISDAVLTAFDLVQHANRVGGFSAVSTVLAELLEEVDFSEAADLGPFTLGVTWQRLGYICEEVLGLAEKAEALHKVWMTLSYRTVNVPLSPFEKNGEGKLNQRWHVRVNLKPEVDDL